MRGGTWRSSSGRSEVLPPTHLRNGAALTPSSRDEAPGPAPSRGRPDTRAIYRSTAASYASLLLLIAADPPDDTGLRDLDERAVVSAGRVRGHAVFRRATEPRARIALAEVAHRAVIDEVERAVGAEHRRVRPVDRKSGV